MATYFILFFICIGLQIISFFPKQPLSKMWLLIGASISGFALSFVSISVGFLWIFVGVLCGVNAVSNYIAYKENKNSKLPKLDL